MDNTLIIDLHIFLGSIYGGLIVGFIYDIYKTIRYYSKPNKIFTYVGDLLFWIILSLLSFYILIKINWGELRGYIIIGFLFGILVYKKIFSKVIYQLCLKLGKIIKKTLGKFIFTLTYPFRYSKNKLSKSMKNVKSIPNYFGNQYKRFKNIIFTKK